MKSDGKVELVILKNEAIPEILRKETEYLNTTFADINEANICIY